MNNYQEEDIKKLLDTLYGDEDISSQKKVCIHTKEKKRNGKWFCSCGHVFKE